MSDRQLIVVDLETTGLDPQAHVPIEVAAINVATGEALTFVPYLEAMDLGHADGEALRINRYFERGVYKLMLNPTSTNEKWIALRNMLDGNTLGGANPRFDAAMLMRAMGHAGKEPWHHRLADISAYVAGARGRTPEELPGLAECCELLGVINHDPHSALGDAEATVACFHKAAALRAGQVR
ncbi:hypothetical protein B5566_02685 [Mycobacterium sp. MHSD3]|nr:hypothetical protein B5566_02685 [Mycobacterium sp. MHSD3]